MNTQYSSLLVEVARDVKNHRSEGALGFEQHKVALAQPLGCYVGPNLKGTRERYYAEVAALTVLSTLVYHCCEQRGLALDLWDTADSSIYDWYNLPNSLRAQVLNLSATNTSNSLALLDQASEWILSQGERDHLGEFYTPSVFADHLVDGLAFEPAKLLETRLADPACGSGVLLGSVAARVMRAIDAGQVDPVAAAIHLGEFFHGFDVQPVAVQLTRLRLILAFLPLLSRLAQGIPTGFLSFPNIRRLDPLEDPVSFWNLFARYQYIVGNPPFSKVVSKRVRHLKYYTRILNGQPNLYQLFMWWSVQALVPGGRVSFLMPQSFRSGAYFERLREELAATCDLVAVTQFANRYAFEGVDSPLMIVVLQKKALNVVPPALVQVRISQDGNGLHNTTVTNIPQSTILRTNGRGPIWHLSDQLSDFALLEKINHLAMAQPKAHSQLKFQNGGFVWNQHKPLLHYRQIVSAIPLIYSSAIKRCGFIFPAEITSKPQKQFVRSTHDVHDFQLSGPSVLVKRTTPKKRGHRVIATLLPAAFQGQYPTYFVENHVNVIQPVTETIASFLAGIVGWLNSRLISFIFQMMNGTSHLSLQELVSFPMPVPLVAQLAPLTTELIQANGNRWDGLWAYLNRLTYDYFDLSERERERVDSWIV